MLLQILWHTLRVSLKDPNFPSPRVIIDMPKTNAAIQSLSEKVARMWQEKMSEDCVIMLMSGVTNEMTKEPPVPDEKTFTPPEVTIERKEI